MAHVWCPATIPSDPHTYGSCLVSRYYTQCCTHDFWSMFRVKLLYTVIYRKLMAHVWCPATIYSDLSNTSGPCLVSSYYTQWYTENAWLMFSVLVLYTVIYQTLIAHIWCSGTIHSDLPKTYGSWLVSSYYTQWCPITFGSWLVSSYYTQWSTEHSVAYAQGPPTVNLITRLSHHQTSLSFITYLILFCWSHQWIHIYLFVSLLQVPLCAEPRPWLHTMTGTYKSLSSVLSWYHSTTKHMFSCSSPSASLLNLGSHKYSLSGFGSWEFTYSMTPL